MQKNYDTITIQQREDSKPALTHAAMQAIEYSWQQGCLPFAKEFVICRKVGFDTDPLCGIPYVWPLDADVGRRHP